MASSMWPNDVYEKKIKSTIKMSSNTVVSCKTSSVFGLSMKPCVSNSCTIYRS